jgi:hypothetical protein
MVLGSAPAQAARELVRGALSLGGCEEGFDRAVVGVRVIGEVIAGASVAHLNVMAVARSDPSNVR